MVRDLTVQRQSPGMRALSSCLGVVVVGSVIVVTRVGSACTITHLPPTNYQLVAAAERIVVVRAPLAPRGSSKPDAAIAPIAMRVERVLKGSPPRPTRSSRSTATFTTAAAATPLASTRRAQG